MNSPEAIASLSHRNDETASNYDGIDQKLLRHLVLAPDMENCNESGDDDDNCDSPVKKAEKAKWSNEEVILCSSCHF